MSAQPVGRVIICSAHFWTSSVQVSAHQFARQFAHAGWEVLFLSTPVTPYHAVALATSREHRRRFAAWLRRGGRDLSGALVHYTPLTVLPLSRVVGLRYRSVLRNWQRFTIPGLHSFLRREKWLTPDVLIVDSALYRFLFERVTARRSVYRITDYNPGFASATPLLRAMEEEAVRAADLVVHTAPELEGYARSLGARTTACIPHGVDLGHFRATPEVAPPEYRAIPAPRAIYVGSLHEWFDYELVNRAAQAHPHVSFVIVGPDLSARSRFATLPNLHVLGPRSYATIPAYLHHSDVGLIPFDRAGHPELVDHINPLKLYEYMAAGLPVVATDWSALRSLNTPALLTARDDFVHGIERALGSAELSRASREFAAAHDWSARFRELMGALDLKSIETPEGDRETGPG